MSYILIDRSKMRVLGVGPYKSMALLAYAEYTEAPVTLAPTDEVRTYAQFLPLQLEDLYQNITLKSVGKSLPYNELCQLLRDTALQLPERVIDVADLEQKAKNMPEEWKKEPDRATLRPVTINTPTHPIPTFGQSAGPNGNARPIGNNDEQKKVWRICDKLKAQGYPYPKRGQPNSEFIELLDQLIETLYPDIPQSAVRQHFATWRKEQ